MNKEEIVRKYENLTLEGRELVDKINDNWAQRCSLEKEYRTLTGKDISERHKAK